jgi:hypothetical protein
MDWEKSNAYMIFVGKPEGKRPLGRPRHRWVDNIKMDLCEIGWGGVDWFSLAQDGDNWRALLDVIMNFWVPQNDVQLLSGYTTGGLLSGAQFDIVSQLISQSVN